MPGTHSNPFEPKPKNGALPSADPAGARAASLASRARALEDRLRVASLTERLASRRAATHLVQLARRVARLLTRVPSLLPALPDRGGDQRSQHFVLHTLPGSTPNHTRLLTISAYSVLRHGESDGSGRPIIWSEYDAIHPAIGWDVELVLERLASVLTRIQTEVEQVESRVADRTRRLDSLLHAPPPGARANRVGSARVLSGPTQTGIPLLRSAPIARPQVSEAPVQSETHVAPVPHDAPLPHVGQSDPVAGTGDAEALEQQASGGRRRERPLFQHLKLDQRR